MRVLLGIGIGMMQAVHDGIGLRAHVGRALCDIGQDEEKALPALAHGKCAMGCIPVLEEGLGKKRGIPNGNEKDKYRHWDLGSG